MLLTIVTCVGVAAAIAVISGCVVFMVILAKGFSR
jgi:hypothetical protein